MADAVTATTGTAATASMSRRRCNVVRPSPSGKRSSSKITSGRSAAADATPSAAVRATTVSYPWYCNTSRASFKFCSLSSMIRIRSPTLGPPRRRDEERAYASSAVTTTADADQYERQQAETAGHRDATTGVGAGDRECAGGRRDGGVALNRRCRSTGAPDRGGRRGAGRVDDDGGPGRRRERRET